VKYTPNPGFARMTLRSLSLRGFGLGRSSK
jgi:hypothetical protein